jgi:hypothetical protein
MRLRVLPGVTLHWGSKDGGPESRVYMYGVECKGLCSALVLRFEDGSRDAYHSHAFASVSRVIGPGTLEEERIGWDTPGKYKHIPGEWVYTARTHLHKVVSIGTTWVLTLRGPWTPTWTEVSDRETGVATVLRSGRVAV